MTPSTPLTRLTWVSGSFRARVLVARLASEGIDARLSGSIDGFYGVTVGDMARVDVFVPDDQVEDARYVLLADEVDAALVAPTEWWDSGEVPRRRARWPWLVAAFVLVGAVLGPLAGLVRSW
ncbi:MAG: hypothetical protein ABW033_01925 [Acidimicrobiia bacterium]